MKQTLTKKKKKSKQTDQQTFNVVPLCELNTVEVNSLYEALEDVVERYIERQGATLAEVVGTVEVLKHDIMREWE